MISKVDLSNVGIRLNNIAKKATDSISFVPSEAPVSLEESFPSPKLANVESDQDYPLHPEKHGLKNGWSIFGYDESTQSYHGLEGELFFCSTAVVKLEERYAFHLNALPHFLTSIRKFEGGGNPEIRFTDSPGKERGLIMIRSKMEAILQSIEPHSIVMIDGPLVGANVSSFMIRMDEELRSRDCVPLYFVKNSDSRLIIDEKQGLANEFNSDFHWASRRLKDRSRSAFFRYTDQYNPKNSKVFAYVKALAGFPERVEMHSETYVKFASMIQDLMNLAAYFYIVQGDYSNPQVRPIAIAEKYAREGLRLLNIPALLSRMGFHPTVNQVRFG